MNIPDRFKVKFRNALHRYTQGEGRMNQPAHRSNYQKHIDGLLERHGETQAMSLAVGGEFEAIGLLEYYLLLQNGLQENHTIIDVGCGSGRLAFQLRDYLDGLYIGMDIVPELFRYAEQISKRNDWKFYAAPGFTIPEPDNSADFVCFFSVFTHLLHEETFRYLEDARRVIKPKGKIIFSFLEFLIPSHWHLFQSSVADTRPEKVATHFLSRDAIAAWSTQLNLSIVEICDGDKPHIKLRKVVTWDDGREEREKGTLGQSVCVLTKQ
jgi:SAM-dependent methyltransferase